MKEKNYRKKVMKIGTMALFCAIVFCAVFLSLDQTRAWLFPVQDTKSEVAISDFKVKGQSTFKGGSAADLSNLSLSPTAANYIGNLKYDISYEGISPAFLRVRILEQWVDRSTNIISDMAFTRYKIAGNTSVNGVVTSGGAIDTAGIIKGTLWYDNRKNDFCYYYAADGGMLAPASILSSGAVEVGKITVPLFDGIEVPPNLTDSNTAVKLIVEVEAVQPNRYREFWKIKHLPWESE